MTDIDRLKSALDNRYTVERELGAGGMATVYLAHDTKHHRKVAVKVLRPELAASLGAERFHREIEVAAQLQHPHILPLLDSGEADGVLYYMMPFVEGESLRDRLAKHGELPVHEAVRILVEIVDALAHAHARGVVHRDIKPDNILLSGRHALVTDFGVAKAVSEATGRQQLTTAGIALGTPSYMAPEQATADPHIDHRVDIYAIGCLAYELLTGRTPFSGLTPQETLAAHVTTPPDPVRKHRDTISPALNDVVMKCLEKRPADRWQSADALLGQLEQHLTPSTGMTPAATAPAKAIEMPRSRAMWIGAAAALVTVGVLAATLGRQRGTTFTLGPASRLTFEAGLEIEPSFSPDGRYVAYTAGPLNSSRMYVRLLDGRPVAVTPDTGEAQRRPLYSPDGNQLLFLQGPTLVVASALGGGARTVVRGTQSNPVVSAAWAPDGRTVAFVRGDTLYVTMIGGGAARAVTERVEMSALCWSPDGKYIAFVSGNIFFATGGIGTFGNLANSQILVVAADGGAPQPITDAGHLNVSPSWTPDSRRLLFVSNRDGPRDVYSVRVASGRPAGAVERITSGLNAHSIDVSRDGSRIAYAIYTARANVYGVNLKAGAVVTTRDARALTSGNQIVEGVSVTADGKRLYFDSDRSGNSDIYRIALPGGEAEQITRDPAPEFNAVESPDGRWIGFHSFRYGQRDLFVVSRDGGEPRRITEDSTHERLIFWSPDGRMISYASYGPGTPQAIYVREWRGDGTVGPARHVSQTNSASTSRPVVAVWSADNRLVVRVDDRLMLYSIDRSPPQVFYAPGARGPRPDALRSTPDGKTLIFRSYGDDGSSTFWAMRHAGDAPRLIAHLNDPARPSTRQDLASDGRSLYFTLTDRESDIQIAELVKR